MILACYISNIVMTVTIQDASLQQPIQGMLKWTEQQIDKCISLQKESHRQRRKIYSCYAKIDYFLNNIMTSLIHQQWLLLKETKMSWCQSIWF